MGLKYALALVLACFSPGAVSHPLHLTFTNLEYQPRNNRWELTIKVFSDDFASDVKLAAGIGAVIDPKNTKEETARILKKWLENRFQIWFDNRPVGFDTWSFKGIRVKEDASWLTYTFTAPMPSSEIRIRNTLLFDLYPDQKNLIIVAMGQFQAAHEFKNKIPETSFKLNK
jgi:hypothetical protein